MMMPLSGTETALKGYKIIKIYVSRLFANIPGFFSGSIRKKLILTFLFLIILPITFSSVLSYVILQQVVKEKVIVSSKSAIPQAALNLERIFRDMRVASDSLMLSDTINKILETPLPEEELQIYANNTNINYEIDKIQTTILSSYPEYSMIAVIDNSGYTYSNLPKPTLERHTVFNSIIGELGTKYTKWGEGLCRIKAPELQRNVPELEKNPSYIVLLRTIIDINKSAMRKGHLVIAMPEIELAKVLRNVVSSEGMKAYVINGSGRVMSSTERDSVEKPYKYFSHISGKDSRKPQTLELKKEHLVVNYKRLQYTGWTVVQEMSTASMAPEVARMRNLIMLINLVFIFVFLGVAYFIANNISKPINKLSTASNLIACGELDTRVDISGNDEVGRLAANFNNMAVEIQELISRNNEAEKTKRELELQMLYAEINPHFLFNTLNSIRWMADACRATSVSKHIVALANLLKNSIIKKNEYITVREEIENIKNYITIQKLRYMYAFDDEYNMTEEILNCKILKLILQPIVENSIIHGFDGIEYKGKISVAGLVQDNAIVIRIADNGNGMDEETLEKLLCENISRKGNFSGIGVSNVNQRLILHFGREYALKMESAPDKGTLTEIRIPLMYEGE